MIKRFYLRATLVVTLFGLFAVFAVLHAQTPGSREELKGNLQQKREELKQEVKDRRDSLKQEIQDKGNAVREEIKTRVEGVKQEVKERRKVFQDEVKEKRAVLREELKTKREAFHEEAKSRREELKKKLGEKRAERIEVFFQKMVEKFEKAFARLHEFAGRIASRLDKAAENGRDVSMPREKLKIAEERIVEAERALEDAKVRYTEAAKDPDLRVAFGKVRELVQGVAAKVRAAHRALVDVITSLKGVRAGGENSTVAPVSSPTPSPEPTQ